MAVNAQVGATAWPTSVHPRKAPMIAKATTPYARLAYLNFDHFGLRARYQIARTMRKVGIAMTQRRGKVRTGVKTNRPMTASRHSSNKKRYTPQRLRFQIAARVVNRARRKLTTKGLNQSGKDPSPASSRRPR